MELETVVLIARTGLTGFLASWLTLGVRDNIVHPSMNRNIVCEVLRMDRLRNNFPDDYALIAHRRIESEAFHKLIFAAVVLFEIVVCGLLWAGTGLQAASLLGYASIETATAWAVAGAFGFSAVWCSFVVIGNHFAYWYCHDVAQQTHFQMAVWGIATMIFLII